MVVGEQDVFLHSKTVKFIKLALLSELAWGQAAIFLLKCSDQKKKKKCCQSCCLGFTLLLFLYSFEYENFDILIFSLSVA